jgi:hypothetical protein
MSKGIICFAFNNPQIDYVKQAIFLAKRSEQFLRLPVTLITSESKYIEEVYPKEKDVFDQIIPAEKSKHATWKRYYNGPFHWNSLPFNNKHRSMAYELSPYDETILLDTDYIINGKQLLKCFNAKQSLMFNRHATDLARWRNTREFNYINDSGIDFYWATAVYFKKSKKAKLFFDTLRHVEENYDHYAMTFNVGTATFRNDHAFSIAAHILNGFSSGDFVKELPTKMYYTLDRDIPLKIQDNKIELMIEKKGYHGQYTCLTVKDLDVHVMNKYELNDTIGEALASG